MLKVPFLSPARIAQALMQNMEKGTTPESVAAQLAALPGVGQYVHNATVDSLWETLMADERARGVIGAKASALHEYVTQILQAARRSVTA